MHQFLSLSGMTHWLSTWGYLGVFICVFIANFGVPVPEETVLLVAGFLAGRHDLELETLYVVGIASAVTGDCCGFLLGRTGGQQLLEPLAQKFHFVRRRYEYLQGFFHAHGDKAVFWRGLLQARASWQVPWQVQRGCVFGVFSDGTYSVRPSGVRW